MRNNHYFVDRGTQVDAMIVSKQVYTLIAAKFITKEETKSNTDYVQQFGRQRFQFQVEEIVNMRERGVKWGNSLSDWIKEHVIVGNLKGYTCHVHMSLLHVSTSI